MGKCVKRSYSINLDYSIGYTEWAVQILCGDPILYGWTEYSATASGTHVNAGDEPVNPLFTVTGAAAGPIRITNSTVGKFIEVSGALTAGQVLEVDFKAKTIKRAGVSIYGNLLTGSRWWKMMPGNNVITTSGGGTTNLKWRDGWLG
jgi:phage-related protein